MSVAGPSATWEGPDVQLTYAVIRCGDIWRIVGERRRIGAFGTPEEAVDTARRLAREAEANGCRVALFLQETGGLLTTCEVDPRPRPAAAPLAEAADA